MKFKILFLLCFILLNNIKAQTPTTPVKPGLYNRGLQFSVRGGYDLIPVYNNNTPYINYRGGWMAGASVDYYFNRSWGLGFDFDYLNNKPKSIYPTDSLRYAGFPVNTLNLTEKKITRTFAGIGPNYRYQKLNNPKWNIEFKLRGGISSIKGGYTQLLGIVPAITPITPNLNFHAGYNVKTAISAKASLQFNYFLSSSFGFHIGAYHINHFTVKELINPALSIASGYHNYTQTNGINTVQRTPVLREDPCNCNINSTGMYAGVTVRFAKKTKEKKCETCQLCNVCGKVHELPMCGCTTCGCKISVMAKDKFSGELLGKTDIIIQSADGTVIGSGATNSFGVHVFENVPPGEYVIRGKLYEINLEETKITRTEFDNCKANGGIIKKEILYTDDNFVLQGKVFECNTTKTVDGVSIQLSNKQLQVAKNTISGADGSYLFHVSQNTTYSLKGNKDGFFSNEVEVNTTTYDRTKSLFIKFEVCIDPCGKAIKLNNINFNVDKWDILPEAEKDLMYIVELMKKNPTIKVELSSHTDSRASHSYNQTLSQKRAESSVNYIVSKGIDRSRLIARGAGETELLNRCADGISCSEEEHRINRRTEFKVLCITNQ